MSGLIHVGFGLHDKTGAYSINVAAVMLSIVERTSEEILFHILIDDSVNVEIKEKLEATISGYNSRIEFHELDPNSFLSKNGHVETFSIGTLFRLVLPDILQGVDKIIYLDADIFVNADIAELWEADMKGKSVAAVHMPDFANGLANTVPVKRYGVEPENYFNAGVLVLNLSRIGSSHSLFDEAMSFIDENPDATFPDQDALNCIFKDDLILLPEKWNIPTAFERTFNKKLREGIYHFAGEKNIYWEKNYDFAEYDNCYLDAKQRSAWGYKTLQDGILKMLSRIFLNFEELQKFLKVCSKNGVRKIFYGNENTQMQNMISCLSVNPSDCFIQKEPSGQIKYGMEVYPLEMLNYEKKGNFVVIVQPDADNGRAMQNLEELGLRRDEDYFVIPCLLPYTQGGFRY